jgi:hypothetical protein
MANTPNKSQMSDDERAQLRAMIAAGRDLSPEMDESLVDSYAEQRAAEQRARAKVQGDAVVPQQPSAGTVAGTHPAVAITGIVATAAIFIAIMVFTHGWLWWMIFPLMGIFGGWWGNNDRNRIRNERRAQRYQMRADYYRQRMGYPPEQDARRLPESTASDSGPLPPPTSTQAPTTAPTPPPAPSAPPSTGVTGEQPPINPAG